MYHVAINVAPEQERPLGQDGLQPSATTNGILCKAHTLIVTVIYS